MADTIEVLERAYSDSATREAGVPTADRYPDSDPGIPADLSMGHHGGRQRRLFRDPHEVGLITSRKTPAATGPRRNTAGPGLLRPHPADLHAQCRAARLHQRRRAAAHAGRRRRRHRRQMHLARRFRRGRHARLGRHGARHLEAFAWCATSKSCRSSAPRAPNREVSPRRCGYGSASRRGRARHPSRSTAAPTSWRPDRCDGAGHRRRSGRLPGTHMVVVGGTGMPDGKTTAKVDRWLRFGNAPQPWGLPEIRQGPLAPHLCGNDGRRRQDISEPEGRRGGPHRSGGRSGGLARRPHCRRSGGTQIGSRDHLFGTRQHAGRALLCRGRTGLRAIVPGERRAAKFRPTGCCRTSKTEGGEA